MPTPAEKGKVTRAANEADPTTYSPLRPEKLKHTDTITILDTHTSEEMKRRVYTDDRGNRYFEITHHPRTQQFVARMLKGIVNVADVLMIKPAREGEEPLFLSKELKIDRIEAKPLADLTADLQVLGSIFRDVDRSVPAEGKSVRETDIGNPRAGGNVRFDEGRSFLFDFESPRDRFFPAMNALMAEQDKHLAAFGKEEAELTLQKLDALAERIEGDEGEAFVRAIAKKTGKNLFELLSPIFGSTVSYEGVPQEIPLRRFLSVLRKRIEEERAKVRARLEELTEGS